MNMKNVSSLLKTEQNFLANPKEYSNFKYE